MEIIIGSSKIIADIQWLTIFIIGLLLLFTFLICLIWVIQIIFNVNTDAAIGIIIISFGVGLIIYVIISNLGWFSVAW